MSTFADGGNGSTQIEALSGGELDLGGTFSGSTTWTADATAGKFNVAKLTKLADATLNVTGNSLTFTAVTTLSDVNMTASAGGQILFPAATSYTSYTWGNTIEATGAKSKIDLSSLSTFAGGGNGSTQIEALSGGELDLGGAFSGSTTWTADATSGKFKVAKVTKLADANLNVSGNSLTFTAVTTLSDVNMTASAGGQILFPVATSYTSYTWGNTIEATGAKSKIDLSSLSSFAGGGNGSTQVESLNGGQVAVGGVCTGAITWTPTRMTALFGGNEASAAATDAVFATY